MSQAYAVRTGNNGQGTTLNQGGNGLGTEEGGLEQSPAPPFCPNNGVSCIGVSGGIQIFGQPGALVSTGAPSTESWQGCFYGQCKETLTGNNTAYLYPAADVMGQPLMGCYEFRGKQIIRVAGFSNGVTCPASNQPTLRVITFARQQCPEGQGPDCTITKGGKLLMGCTIQNLSPLGPNNPFSFTSIPCFNGAPIIHDSLNGAGNGIATTIVACNPLTDPTCVCNPADPNCGGGGGGGGPPPNPAVCGYAVVGANSVVINASGTGQPGSGSVGLAGSTDPNAVLPATLAWTITPPGGAMNADTLHPIFSGLLPGNYNVSSIYDANGTACTLTRDFTVGRDLCAPGYYPNGNVCTPCANGSYKSTVADEACIPCGTPVTVANSVLGTYSWETVPPLGATAQTACQLNVQCQNNFVYTAGNPPTCTAQQACPWTIEQGRWSSSAPLAPTGAIYSATTGGTTCNAAAPYLCMESAKEKIVIRPSGASASIPGPIQVTMTGFSSISGYWASPHTDTDVAWAGSSGSSVYPSTGNVEISSYGPARYRVYGVEDATNIVLGASNAPVLGQTPVTATISGSPAVASVYMAKMGMGNYSVQIKDANNCSRSFDFNIPRSNFSCNYHSCPAGSSLKLFLDPSILSGLGPTDLVDSEAGYSLFLKPSACMVSTPPANCNDPGFHISNIFQPPVGSGVVADGFNKKRCVLSQSGKDIWVSPRCVSNGYADAHPITPGAMAGLFNGIDSGTLDLNTLIDDYSLSKVIDCIGSATSTNATNPCVLDYSIRTCAWEGKPYYMRSSFNGGVCPAAGAPVNQDLGTLL